MFRWQRLGNAHADRTAPAAPHLPVPDAATPSEQAVFRFAAEHGTELRLYLDLCATAPGVTPPSLQWHPDTPDGTLQAVESGTADVFRYCIIVPARPADSEDDECIFHLCARDESVPPCRVELRRTGWTIDETLLEQRGTATPLRAQARAALLWHGWRRFRKVTVLKRIRTGLSGSDVLVVQPLLRSDGWGTRLLVKTGQEGPTVLEWANFHEHLADRLHPFLSRYEACLSVRPPGHLPGPPMTTIIGSFLGGDALEVEPFDAVVRGGGGAERCQALLEKLFVVAGTWYAAARHAPLREWPAVFPTGDPGRGLFRRYDFKNKEHRQQYSAPFAWDPLFGSQGHLDDHLLGKGDGLLHRLASIPVRYSLTHGDLHPRNILADQENVWLLDFGDTGTDSPTLFDFAKLEVYLRLWCLDLGAESREFDEGACEIESRMLDVLLGTEQALTSLCGLAPRIGADPAALLKVASCICWARRRASAYTLGGPERRDYLAVLYLTVLRTLRFAAGEKDRLANYRWLLALAWLLEDRLTRLVGLPPFERGRGRWDARSLLTARWLAAPNAAARVAYLMRRKDGREALPFLAATRGVMQNQNHHLDVFDHTLLVLAALEELLRDPLSPLSR